MEKLFQIPWSGTQPVPVDQAADFYGSQLDDLLRELRQLGVPTFVFQGQRVFYFCDLYAAHSQPREETGRVERTEHLDRVLDLLRVSGCMVEDHPRTKGRPSDVFTLRNAEDPDRSLVLRVQVCSKIQSGQAIHFNIPTESLKQGVKWYWLVAAPFGPRWDFLMSSDDVGREFGPALEEKKVVTKRIKAEGYEHLDREHRLEYLLSDLGIGHFARKRAQQKAQDEATGSKPSID